MHQEGEQLIAAERQAHRGVLDGASDAELALLGPTVADPEAMTGLVDDDPPCDDSEEAQAEWEQTCAEWIATGFPSGVSRPARWPRMSPVRWTKAS